MQLGSLARDKQGARAGLLWCCLVVCAIWDFLGSWGPHTLCAWPSYLQIQPCRASCSRNMRRCPKARLTPLVAH